MTSPNIPVHGKTAAIYRLRPNGFKGNGLNDVTWGLLFTGAASAYYEAVIDALDTAIKTVTVGAGGTGYTVDDILTVVQSGASGGTVKVTSVDAGVITGISLETAGKGYSVADGLAVTGGTGSDATVNITAVADTFKWRKNAGSWTENVAITGAAQTLDDGQTIAFTATTGHTVADQWMIGNLKNEPCEESGTEAQIEETTRHLLNANAIPTFTDTGAKNVTDIQLVLGKAIFDGNVTVVTVTGNNGYIVRSALELLAYSFNWSFSSAVDIAVIPQQGKKWKSKLTGQAEATGGAESYFIGGDSFFDALKKAAEGGDRYFLVELYSYEPDLDQTGDRFVAWAAIKGVDINASINEVVKEPITFEFHGLPKFVANV